jgi:hypothetical protein
MPTVELSSFLANRCLSSCEEVGQKASLYEGFDGTKNEIIVPDHLKKQSFLKSCIAKFQICHKYTTEPQETFEKL